MDVNRQQLFQASCFMAKQKDIMAAVKKFGR